MCARVCLLLWSWSKSLQSMICHKSIRVEGDFSWSEGILCQKHIKLVLGYMLSMWLVRPEYFETLKNCSLGWSSTIVNLNKHYLPPQSIPPPITNYLARNIQHPSRGRNCLYHVVWLQFKHRLSKPLSLQQVLLFTINSLFVFSACQVSYW